ncbi:hypothetical protein LguiA_008899 [Lonicera macranthoides]
MTRLLSCRQKTLGCHTDCSKCKLLQGKLCGDCLYTRPQVLTQTVEEEEAELSGGNSALGSDEEDGDGGGEVEEGSEDDGSGTVDDDEAVVDKDDELNEEEDGKGNMNFGPKRKSKREYIR